MSSQAQTQIPGGIPQPESIPTEPARRFTFSIDDSVKEFTVPMRSYLDSHPEYDAVATGCLVVHAPPSSHTSAPRLLVMKRSAHDSMPGRWETPGGGCDLDDESILHGAVRDLREESGLVAARVTARVGGEQVFFSRRGMRICKVNFDVEVQGGRGEEPPEVRLDPNEHEAFLWITEEEARAGRTGEVELRFTTRQQEEVIWEEFERRRAVEVNGGTGKAVPVGVVGDWGV